MPMLAKVLYSWRALLMTVTTCSWEPHHRNPRESGPDAVHDRRLIIVAALLLLAGRASAQADNEAYSVPEEVTRCLARDGLADKYTTDMTINPFYLRGDFDGDGKADYLFRVV